MKYSKEFIIQGTLQLLKKHLDLEIDEQEIDPALSIGENYEILKQKYTNPSMLDVLDEM